MDIDGTVLAGLIFSLLCLLVIGGFILMYPLTRRLGALMEQRLEDRKTGGPNPADREGAAETGAGAGEMRQVRAALESLQTEVARLGERQQFMERLLESGQGRKEPSGP